MAHPQIAQIAQIIYRFPITVSPCHDSAGELRVTAHRCAQALG
jgi:hypothetical protein